MFIHVYHLSLTLFVSLLKHPFYSDSCSAFLANMTQISILSFTLIWSYLGVILFYYYFLFSYRYMFLADDWMHTDGFGVWVYYILLFMIKERFNNTREVLKSLRLIVLDVCWRFVHVELGSNCGFQPIVGKWRRCRWRWVVFCFFSVYLIAILFNTLTSKRPFCNNVCYVPVCSISVPCLSVGRVHHRAHIQIYGVSCSNGLGSGGQKECTRVI